MSPVAEFFKPVVTRYYLCPKKATEIWNEKPFPIYQSFPVATRRHLILILYLNHGKKGLHVKDLQMMVKKSSIPRWTKTSLHLTVDLMGTSYIM